MLMKLIFSNVQLMLQHFPGGIADVSIVQQGSNTASVEQESSNSVDSCRLQNTAVSLWATYLLNRCMI